MKNLLIALAMALSLFSGVASAERVLLQGEPSYDIDFSAGPDIMMSRFTVDDAGVPVSIMELDSTHNACGNGEADATYVIYRGDHNEGHLGCWHIGDNGVEVKWDTLGVRGYQLMEFHRNPNWVSV